MILRKISYLSRYLLFRNEQFLPLIFYRIIKNHKDILNTTVKENFYICDLKNLTVKPVSVSLTLFYINN